jgi:hypothetical protein
MIWIFRKLDSLAAAAVAAVGAMVCAQLPEFIQQYLQRLGGHIDEAKRALRTVADSVAFQALDPAGRAAAVAAHEARVATLQIARDAIAGAGPIEKPYALVRHLDPDIAAGAWSVFKPAVPLEPLGLAYALVGLVGGWLVYEMLTGAAGLVFRRRSAPPETA